jgi:hypothetical protein
VSYLNGSSKCDAELHSALGSTRAFQSLPRHLRRRAASHNPRRVPKRYRSRAAAEVRPDHVKCLGTDRQIRPGSNVVKIHRKRARTRAKGNVQGESVTEQLLKRQRTSILSYFRLGLIFREQIMAPYSHLARQTIPYDECMGISITSNTYTQIVSNCLSR